MKIDSFRGEYAFLSNFYPAITEYEGVLYPTSEHAYQAAKTENLKARELIRTARTPGEAKRMGKKVELRPGWAKYSGIRLSAMLGILSDKFSRNVELKQKLMDTDPAELIEGNYWNDTFWGVCRGKGDNHLGKLLMALREVYIEDAK